MMYDFACECGWEDEQFFHRQPESVPCPICGGQANYVLNMRRGTSQAQSFAPIVIHRDAEGNTRFPGHADAAVPPDFQKVELRTVRDVRKFEREMNDRERTAQQEHIQREAENFSQTRSGDRIELERAMKSMSPFGRALAEQAIEHSDRQREARLSAAKGDPNFHVEVFSMDSSNREAYRDARTGWKAKRD